MPRRIALLTILCLLVSAHGAARGSTRESAHGGKELRRAEAVLSKLRRLEVAAADAADPAGFAKAARKIYPGLFAEVSKLRDGELKTELSTAAALYESALRVEAVGGAADCSREVRESYARLCQGTGGARTRLLRAKALLHAGRAEAELLYARGDRAPATLEAIQVIRAERATDRVLAEEALRELKGLAAELGGATPDEADAQHEHLGARAAMTNETIAGRLEQIDRLLSSLPRDRARQLLGSARDAFRDGLYWQFEAEPARALVVNANSFAAEPGALPRLGLRADDADRTALANLRAALKFIRRAEDALGR
jgi:hypothetical protein